nr:uncharacterized protein LOC129044975 [Pongo pygmaeus]
MIPEPAASASPVNLFEMLIWGLYPKSTESLTQRQNKHHKKIICERRRRCCENLVPDTVSERQKNRRKPKEHDPDGDGGGARGQHCHLPPTPGLKSERRRGGHKSRLLLSLAEAEKSPRSARRASRGKRAVTIPTGRPQRSLSADKAASKGAPGLPSHHVPFDRRKRKRPLPVRQPDNSGGQAAPRQHLCFPRAGKRSPDTTETRGRYHRNQRPLFPLGPLQRAGTRRPPPSWGSGRLSPAPRCALQSERRRQAKSFCRRLLPRRRLSSGGLAAW